MYKIILHLFDMPGRSFILQSIRVTGLKIELLGETSVASSISYLDNAVVFVGSSYGDSQV